MLALAIALVLGLLALLWSERDYAMSDAAPGVLFAAALGFRTTIDLSAHWRLVDAGPAPGIAADIENGEWRQTITFAIIPNTDPSLPASHIVEIKIPDVYPGRKVVDLRGLFVKAGRQDVGRQLIGAVVEVADGTFWVALSGVPRDRDTNLKLLFDANSFQMNLAFANGTDGVLVIDKGEAGRRVFDAAFAAWRGTTATQ